MLKVFIDGCCEPNPGGTAAFGLVVYQEEKRLLAKGKVIGGGVAYSNNLAEYAGLLEFLRIWQGTEDTVVYSDSLMLVKQMSGEWQARQGLYLESYQKAKTMSQGKPIRFAWIPREENGEADKCCMNALSAVGIKSRRFIRTSS